MSNRRNLFKIGDKVQVTELEPSIKYRGKIGIITNVDRIRKQLSNRWDYECKFPDGDVYVFKKEELIHFPLVGAQLLLFEEV